MPLFYTDMMQIRNECIVHWFRPEYDANHPKFKRINLIHNFKGKKTYTGMVTASTVKRIRTAVDLLLQTSPSRKVVNPYTKKVITHRLSFITLTIPDICQNYTPKQGHVKLLKPFLRYIREKGLMDTYIWKAELQERGQLHYHITTPSVIDLRLIRKYWNGLLTKNGMLKDFYERYNHFDPNSTDIHQVHKLNDIHLYLVKYLTKGSQNQTPTTGKIWDCSENLKGKKYLSLEMTKPNMVKVLKAADAGKLMVKETERCAIIKGAGIRPKDLLTTDQQLQYNEFLLSIRG